MVTKIETHYKSTVIPKLQMQFEYKNIHNIPKLIKIVINSGLRVTNDQKHSIEILTKEIKAIGCQCPVLSKAKKSSSGFKIREGMPLRLFVTLRRHRMYAFLEKFICLTLPRIRDFQGFSTRSFDKEGNYNFGISDQSVFPEIKLENIDQPRGFTITFVTSAKTLNESKALLSGFGIPFSD
jgi:large subunit ribosomal protein L5